MAHDITDAQRRAVAERAGYRCEYCRIHEQSTGFSHQIDHVISRKHGGSRISIYTPAIREPFINPSHIECRLQFPGRD